MENNNIFQFLKQADVLCEMPRTGWVLMGAEHPESVAEHTFRLAVLAWIFAERKGLHSGRAVRIALAHDLCEVYAGDITTLLYHPDLAKEKDGKKRKEIEKKWGRLSVQEKERVSREKFRMEQDALERLIASAPPRFRSEVLLSWFDYEKLGSREAALVHELNSIETLIQSIEYFGTDENDAGTTWWESTEEVVRDPDLISFLKTIQHVLYENGASESDLRLILTFTLAMGGLKRKTLGVWKDGNEGEGRALASHGFLSALFSWTMSKDRDREPGVDAFRAMKMALCYYLGFIQETPFSLYQNALKISHQEGRREIVRWMRLSVAEKERIAAVRRKQETQALEDMFRGLPSSFSEEVFALRKELDENKTKEARLVNEARTLESVFQVLQYKKKNPAFSVEPWWEWAFERIDTPHGIAMLDIMKNEFGAEKTE